MSLLTTPSAVLEKLFRPKLTTVSGHTLLECVVSQSPTCLEVRLYLGEALPPGDLGYIQGFLEVYRYKPLNS